MQSRCAWGFFLLVGCGSPAVQPGDDSGTQTSDDAAVAQDNYVPFGDSSSGDGGVCDPPDMLVVLDRSDSMNKPPDGADAGASKWTLAVAALDDITAAPIDGTLRFGLELLPDQEMKKGDAGSCASGLLSIDTGLGNGAQIASTLASTQLMSGTPIGGALAVAQSTLAKGHVEGRSQDVLLVTDGKETCDAAPPLPVVHNLAKAGVHTYVVGFGGSVDAAMLNDLACAGLTAKDFANSCKNTPGGYVSNVQDTTHVYFDAASGDDLKSALAAIASGTCCGCQIN